MANRKCTLFVGGLSSNSRAKDVAYAFEKYGRLVRCDIPAPGGVPRGYAFIEFEDERDAEDAYDRMRDGARIDGRTISLQWAKREPSRAWRGGDERPGSGGSDRGSSRRSPSPRRSRSRSRSPRRGRSPRRSASPAPARARRSASPPARRRSASKSRSPSRSRSRSR